jgi:4-diphosphocytidyl-2-C-methyl-D-erythritol kinase
MTHIIAPAKLTLSLKVTGVREDGFHFIDAEMVSLQLHDVLTITEGETGMSVSGTFADGVPTDNNNLVLRALQLAGKTAHIHIEKHIPHGGGLGGGSSDAAAVLRWAGYTDLVAASRLGADIAFCIHGGHARVTGIGEILEPLPYVSRHITLVVPPFGVATPAVYAAFDSLTVSHDGPNDLEPAAIAVEPRLAIWRDRIREASGQTPVLAGSGATWWLDGVHPRIHEALSEATVVVTQTRPM